MTFRLADSVPKRVIEGWRSELSNQPDTVRQIELKRRIARYEDAGHGECLLGIGEHARAVQDCLLHADGRRYRLIEWCVMPNHVHVLIETLPGMRLGDIVRTWKTYSAKSINGRLQRHGSIWEEDYHDRYIRDNDHLSDARNYIRRNPVKAGLCASPEDWQWSSAPPAHVAGATFCNSRPRMKAVSGTATIPHARGTFTTALPGMKARQRARGIAAARSIKGMPASNADT